MLHNEELHSLYFSPNRVNKCAGHVARMEEVRGAFKILPGKPIGKKLKYIKQ